MHLLSNPVTQHDPGWVAAPIITRSELAFNLRSRYFCREGGGVVPFRPVGRTCHDWTVGLCQQ